MTGFGAQGGIHCPIDLFAWQQAKIEELTKTINAAAMTSEKITDARVLSKKAGILLHCARYDAADRNCMLCRNFSERRLKTASLVIKMGAGDRPGAHR